MQKQLGALKAGNIRAIPFDILIKYVFFRYLRSGLLKLGSETKVDSLIKEERAKADEIYCSRIKVGYRITATSN
jgi:hypothetical protein